MDRSSQSGTPTRREVSSIDKLRDATANSAQAFLSDLVNSSLPASSVDGAKQALSLRTTTLQFTRFVHKTGPVFDISDAIEAVLRWQDPVQTLVVGCVWALVCLYPHLLLLMPSASLVTLLLIMHGRRYPPAPISVENPYQESETVKAPASGQPPTEGSPDYMKNMQNIQELMGRIADVTDKGRSLVPYLNWSDHDFTLTLLQASTLITLLLSLFLLFFSPYLDMRYVFLFLGESTLLACHPVSVSLAQRIAANPASKLLGVRALALLSQIRADDALPDYIALDARKEIKEIVVFENERKSPDGSWSTDTLRMGKDPQAWQVLLDGKVHSHAPAISAHTPSATDGKEHRSKQGDPDVWPADPTTSSESREASREREKEGEEPVKFETIRPPGGFEWIPNEQWQIDRLGLWVAEESNDKTAAQQSSSEKAVAASHSHSIGVDVDGWAFTDADGREVPFGSVGAAYRRRRWFRRIVTRLL